MASTRFILLVLLACFFFSSYIVIDGVEGGRRLISKDEDIELEKQLKLLNKPAIKSIQTKYGDIYDCIDFYKQPAFDHPLLKNHTFYPEMRPSSAPNLMREEENFISKSSNETYIGLRVDCPLGTVPIKRVTKDDLIREKLHLEKYNPKYYNVLNTENPGTHYAILQTTSDPKKTYYGGGVKIGIFNPSLTSSSQYSSARMKVQNGLESIEAGWTVNPTLYGDTLTRKYISFDIGHSRCFNVRCPGFVVVDPSLPIDSALPISTKNTGYRFIPMIYKDQPVSNWWLELYGTRVGFWPERIFNNLKNPATSVEWGGEVFSPPDIPSPPMGSGAPLGKFPVPGTPYVAYCEGITTINEANKVVSAEDTQVYKDSDRYNVIDDIKGDWDGHTMFFGGPGKATGN